MAGNRACYRAGAAGSMLRIAEILHAPPARVMTNDDHILRAAAVWSPAISYGPSAIATSGETKRTLCTVTVRAPVVRADDPSVPRTISSRP